AEASRRVTRGISPGEERHEQRPRQQSDGEHRKVEVKRLAMAVVGIEHAPEMLTDEVEVGEARLAYGHRDKPRRRDKNREQKPRYRAEFRDRAAQFAIQCQPKQHRENWNRRTHWTLGHHGQTHRDVRDPAPSAALIPVESKPK